jgi:sialic acid synthase SpsE
VGANLSETPIKVIAELGVNHLGDMRTAKIMIEKAKETEASFVKLQYYKVDALYPKDHPLYRAVKKTQFSIERIGELKDYAEKDVGIPFVCTVFKSPELVEDLEHIGLQYYKIRYADSQNWNLINRVLETGKTVFISTNRMPIDPHYLYHPRIKWLYINDRRPSLPSDFELERVGVFDGFSSHHPNILVPLAAAIMAKAKKKKEFYIEVHCILDHSIDTPDAPVSLDFKELKTLIEYIRMVEQFS